MRRSNPWLIFACLPVFAWAEDPLSAIDWLKEPPPITVAQPLIEPIGEPKAFQGTHVPSVDVTPLGGARADAVGLLPSGTTGLPLSLWESSTTQEVIERIERLPHMPLPALQALIYTLLLAEADPPSDTAENARFLHARVDALQHYGAVDAALSLVERAGTETSILFDDWMRLSLLRGTEQKACRLLSDNPMLSDSYETRVFCLVRTGDWPTAALIYDTAAITGNLDPDTADQLALFLDPELAEDALDLPPPRNVTPLLFRLHEANGSPLPTRPLPREFAAADLRGTMGWRAEIEAAERLARTGALPANRLLGLYTSRRPAASGGIWDRVAALQEFDRAMLSGDDVRIAAALPDTWNDMKSAGLSVVFATLFGERLARHNLPGLDGTVYEIGLLSPSYEALSTPRDTPTRHARFLEGVALGQPDASLAQTATEQAIARAFDATAPARKYAEPLSEGKLGQTILDVITDLNRSVLGQSGQIDSALATLRFVGLEDVARQTALQILLLPPS